jgi:hypothetical protein
MYILELACRYLLKNHRVCDQDIFACLASFGRIDILASLDILVPKYGTAVNLFTFLTYDDSII